MMVDFTYYKSEKEILRKLPEELLPYLKYWNACTKIESLSVPCNSEISPAIFKNHLPWISLMLIDDVGTATYKVQGTGLAHLYGDYTGLTINETDLPEIAKANFKIMIQTVISESSPIYQEGLGLKRKRNQFKNVRLLSLPFSKSGAYIDHILFISHSDYPEAKAKPLY